MCIRDSPINLLLLKERVIPRMQNAWSHAFREVFNIIFGDGNVYTKLMSKHVVENVSVKPMKYIVNIAFIVLKSFIKRRFFLNSFSLWKVLSLFYKEEILFKFLFLFFYKQFSLLKTIFLSKNDEREKERTWNIFSAREKVKFCCFLKCSCVSTRDIARRTLNCTQRLQRLQNAYRRTR